jgi:outer membrane protein
MKQMKKMVAVAVLLMSLVMMGHTSKAQMKVAYISLQELIPSMPESKKADSALQEYQNALGQNYDDMRREYIEQDSLLSSKDSAKYTKAQLEVKKRNLVELAQRLQTWQQTAQQMYQNKYQELIAPIQKKAVETVQAVAKEAGYNYVISKEALLVSPPGDDLLPAVKKKLGLK